MSTRRRAAVSLIELLVVVAILAVLVALTAAGVQAARRAAARAVCADRLRQLALALHNHHAARGALPPGVSVAADGKAFPYMTWRARILPYIEQDARWRQAVDAYRVQPNYPPPDPPHPSAAILPALVCPADPAAAALATVPGTNGPYTVARSSYLGVSGRNQVRKEGMLFLDSAVKFGDATDGTSNTLLLGERPPSPDGHLGWWYAGVGQNNDGSAASVMTVRERVSSVWGAGCPDGAYHFTAGKLDNQCDAFHFWSLHPGGAYFAFADGSVRFLTYSADDLLPALATRAGGEAVTLD